MKQPVLDPRNREDIMARLAVLARAYTPQWRYEGAEDDPGSALAELFGDMFYQTVDRFNSIPGKLHTEFLNLTGFQMPDPIPASGLIQFTAHDTVEEPVPVEEGTELFAQDEAGEHIVYETRRRIESTPAQLQELLYADPRTGIIQRLDPGRTQPFFCPTEGENLQCHRFTLSRDDVLTLSGPCIVEVELRQESGFDDAEIARQLADPDRFRWSFSSPDGETSFDTVEAAGGTLLLTYRGNASFAPDSDGHYSIICAGNPVGELRLDSATLRSRPLERLPVDGAANGDIPLDLAEGDYCFGRRPAAYSICYFRSDQAFSKRGARVNLRLDVVPVITGPDREEPQYQFTQRIIDKRDAVAVVPDDVYVAQVTWEYFNGLGWRPLAVSGSRNPFSCREEGPLEVIFTVPDDLAAADVNAQKGCYIRARVVHVENQFSMTPRWLIPFLKGATCVWAYDRGLPAQRLTAENNGSRVTLEEAEHVQRLAFPALEALAEHPRAMYFRFDRSPHAMPLSIFFDMAGRVKLDDKVRFEAWTGSRFEPVRTVDLTRNLLHSGTMLLYLPKPLPTHTFFGREGCWLRLSRSTYLDNSGEWPRVNALHLNVVEAVQREQAAEERFSVSAYEAGKALKLLYHPVLEAQVWVDEIGGVAVSDAQALAQAMPHRVELEWEDRVLTHCWVRWERRQQLALAGPEDRCYSLDPYEGEVTFGDGIHGRVPPQGEENLRLRYCFGGGSRGNQPVGAVTRSVGSLPRISQIENITPMSGGTDRLSLERVDTIGSRTLRHRGRAAGAGDFEEMVLRDFPQVRHVKCFPGRDGVGASASGHVSVVVEGCDLDDRRVTDDICQRIYETLSRQCDCVLAAEGRLHVVGSTVITVSSTVTVEISDPDQGAVTQQEIARRLEELINSRWREREIGDQIRVAQVWQTVRDTPNVRLVRNILLEGWYDQAGVRRVAALEADDAFPYATVKSGVHFIQVE